MDNDNTRPVLLPAQPTIHNILYGTATRLQRTASISAAINRRDRIVLQKGKKVRPVCRIIGKWSLRAGERCWLHHIHPSADDGCHVAMVLGDDMDIFVLLVYWALHCDLQGDLAIQMEKWDGIVL